MTGPLRELKVVDCSQSTAGWRMTQLFADYAADVVWVEPPGGHPARRDFPLEHAVFNRGKRSVVLDLDSEAGLAELRRLVARADVFVETSSPGDAERDGFGWDDLHESFPALVYCSISGFGAEGSLRDVPGHEALVHAVVGTMAEQPGIRDAPIFEGVPFASVGAAYLGATGTLAALYRRHLDGRGRRVETSLLDGALSYLMMLWGDSDKGSGSHAPGAVRLVARSFLCADGEYLGVHTGAVGAFDRLMKVLGLEEQFAVGEAGAGMGVQLDPAQAALVEHELPKLFEGAPRAEWLRLLREADVCAVEHLHPGEVFDEPQVRHNEMVVEVDDPELGRLQQVGPAAKFSVTPAAPSRPAPEPGQHGAAIEWAESSSPSVSDEPDSPDVPLLDGVRVLDLGAFYAGPYTSRLLADLGADVVKLEPVAGDPLRGLGVVFRNAQAGKRAAALNLKDPELAAARKHLLQWADVVHHNMRPGAAERLGVGYDDVRALRNDIIYLYAPGWGSSGPDSTRQSFAPKMSGYVGAGFEVAGRFNPPLFPTGNEDPGNGLVGAVATLMALIHRQRTGEGQYVENPQLNATMTHLAHIVRRPSGEVLGAERLDPMQLGFSAFERLYRTQDGWVCLVAHTDAELAALGRAVPTLFDGDPDSRASRAEHDDLLAIRLEAAIGALTTAECLASFGAAGVPVVAPTIEHNAVAFLRDAEQQRLGRVAVTPHARDGQVREIDQLMRVSGARTVRHRIAPELGEHTDAVLHEAGYSADQIKGLRDRGSAR